jgi:Fe-S cluster assembly iron-binding protein IscA
MLKVTREAALALKEARTQTGAPDDSGVRLAKAAQQGGDVLSLGFQQQPEATDEIVEQEELRFFIADDVVEPLSEKTLDVVTTDRGAELVLR